MTDVRTTVVCAECGVFWPEDSGDAKCADPDHRHERYEVHIHRTPVVLPDGTGLTAVSFDASDPYAREVAPDYGLYLDDCWEPPWLHEHIAWPDFGVPEDRAGAVAALDDLLARARRHEQVEIGCVGGHGRTGTALACMAVRTGCPKGDAVAWVRENYCAFAIETEGQVAFVASLPR